MQNLRIEAEKLAQQLKALATLAEDLVPNTWQFTLSLTPVSGN